MSCDRNPWRNRELGIGVLLLVVAAPWSMVVTSGEGLLGLRRA